MDKANLLKIHQEQKYADYLYDIELANKALSDIFLNISEEEIICDL